MEPQARRPGRLSQTPQPNFFPLTGWLARPRAETGSGTVLAGGVVVVVLALTALVAAIALGFVALHQVRGAADLVALSGAAAYSGGGDACADARQAAADNHVRLRRCELVGDSFDFVVTVEVGRAIPVLAQEWLVVRAHAGRLSA